MESTKKSNELHKAKVLSYAKQHKMTEQDVNEYYQKDYDEKVADFEDQVEAGKNPRHPRLMTFAGIMNDDGYYNEVHSEAGGFISAFKEGYMTQKQLERIVDKVLSVSDMEKLVKAHNKLHGKK